MKLKIFFSLFKNKSKLNSEDKLQSSFAGKSRSAWSWSYDATITERLEAAMKLEKKSNHSEINFEEKHLELNLDEDLEKYIFQKSPQNHELTIIERIISASQVFDKINQKNEKDYPQKSPRNLRPLTEVSVDESSNDVRRLRLSDMQNQRSWLNRITRPFPNDNKNERKPETMQKQWKKYQIQAVLIEYLLQFIQKTALPTIKKYEQLKKMYSKEMKEWTKRAEFLERQNYWLKSELQKVDKSYRGTEEGFTDSKKIYSQARLGIDVRGNFLLPVPAYDEIRRSLDFDQEALVIPDVKSYVSLEPESTGETEEFTDFKQGYYRQANHIELEEAVSVNESQINYKDFPNTEEKLEKSDTMNLQRNLEEDSLQSRNTENLKAGNAPFESSGVNVQKEPVIAQIISLTKLDCKSPNKGTFGVEASRDNRVCGSRTVQEEATAYVPHVGEWAGRKVSCETRDWCKSKVKTLPETEFIDPYVLALSDSWYLQIKNRAFVALCSRISKVEKERGVVCPEKISSLNTSQSPGFKNQYRMDNIISNNSISGIAIRSMWI